MRQHWINKFRNAFRGLAVGAIGQSSFAIHLPVGIAAIITGITIGCTILENMVLVLCVGLVLSLELANSSIEYMAQALCPKVDPRIRDALDTASGAVLVASIATAIVGVFILGSRLIEIAAR